MGRVGDAPLSTTIDALLFDLGRVLIALDTARMHARWAQLAGVPLSHVNERAAARIVGSGIFRGHERGEIADAVFFAYLRRELEIELTDDQFLDGWNAIFVGEMPGIRETLSRVHGKLPLYVFSNTNAAHQVCWARQFADLLASFRKVYASNEIGVRKPDPEAFRTVVAAMRIAPERVLFFDDSAENVHGARAAGLMAAQVASAADIDAALRGFGLTG